MFYILFLLLALTLWWVYFNYYSQHHYRFMGWFLKGGKELSIDKNNLAKTWNRETILHAQRYNPLDQSSNLYLVETRTPNTIGVANMKKTMFAKLNGSIKTADDSFQQVGLFLREINPTQTDVEDVHIYRCVEVKDIKYRNKGVWLKLTSQRVDADQKVYIVFQKNNPKTPQVGKHYELHMYPFDVVCEFYQ